MSILLTNRQSKIQNWKLPWFTEAGGHKIGMLMCQKSVQETFDHVAAGYDRLKLLIIPRYEEVVALIDDYATYPEDQALRLLEMGTGTAQWAASFLARHPRAVYEGIEFSAKMREIAGRRLAPFGPRASLLADDLNTVELAPGYDLVVSFYAIHHVLDKDALFTKVYEALNPRGIFVYADITSAEHPELEQRFMEGWIKFMECTSLKQERIPLIIQDHLENDLPETTAAQLKYFQYAGFQAYDLIWRHEKFAAFFGKK
jgi:tRNA (cmo5U34)-methyltransferase